MKKFLAVFLSLVIFVIIIAPMSAVAEDSCNCDTEPIIYIRGCSPIYIDKGDPIESSGFFILVKNMVLNVFKILID